MPVKRGWNSWKDIASYLNRDVRTVIRWERGKGLPVHRIPGGQRPPVFAYREELEAWMNHGPDPREPGAQPLWEQTCKSHVAHVKLFHIPRPFRWPFRIVGAVRQVLFKRRLTYYSAVG